MTKFLPQCSAAAAWEFGLWALEVFFHSLVMCPDLDCPLKVDFLNSNYWSPKPIVYYPFKLTLTNLSSSSSVGVWCLRCLRSFLTVCVILPSWWSCWHYYYYNYFLWFVGENFAKWPSLYYLLQFFNWWHLGKPQTAFVLTGGGEFEN